MHLVLLIWFSKVCVSGSYWYSHFTSDKAHVDDTTCQPVSGIQALWLKAFILFYVAIIEFISE